MQGEFRAAALRDHGRAVGVDEIVVPPLAGDDLPVELVGAEDHLHQLADAPLAFQLDAGLLAHRAGAAVAADEIAAAQLLARAGSGAGLHRHALVVLDEILQPAAVAHGDVGRRLRHLLQERLQLVLRHQLIRLQQAGAVRTLGDLLAALRHRGIFQHRDRRIAEPGGQEHVHRVVGRITQRPHPIGDADAAIELHGARVRAVHLRIGQRGRAALDQQAAHAAPAKVDGQRQADRPGAGNDHVVSGDILVRQRRSVLLGGPPTVPPRTASSNQPPLPLPERGICAVPAQPLRRRP